MGICDRENPLTSTELCHLAEERLGTRNPDPATVGATWVSPRLLHELQLHQIELEMQNLQLHEANDAAATLLANYVDLYDFAPVGYLTLDRGGTICAANLSCARLLGMERARLIGLPFARFVEGGYLSRFREFIGKVFARQGKDSLEVRLATTDARPLVVRVEATASESGSDCRVAVIDITGLKLSEEKNLQLNEELRLLNGGLEQQVERCTAELKYANSTLTASYRELESSYHDLEVFSYAVAHELRTPLRSMCGFGTMLLEEYADKLDTPGNDWLKRIVEAAGRMGRLVDGILNLSRLARIALNREKVSLSELAGSVVTELRALNPELHREVSIAQDVTAYGDAALLRQVLENLLDNAWKYTGTCSAPKIAFAAACIDGETVYSVRDNGIGFDMCHTAKLFTPFERLHGINEFEGIGIGLATVHRIIARHNGRIWVEGMPGEGACFYFTLPHDGAREAHAKAPHRNWLRREGCNPGRRIAPPRRRAVAGEED